MTAPVTTSAPTVAEHAMTLPGSPRAADVVRDALRSMRAQPVPSLAAAVVVGLVCMVVLLTTGRTAAVEREVLASVDSIGTRLIVVSDASGDANIDRSTVGLLASLDEVDWAFGLGPAADVHNSVLGPRGGGIAGRPFVGEFPVGLQIVEGRAPVRPGEAVAGTQIADALGLGDGTGPLTDGTGDYPAVGVVDGEGALDFLNETVIWSPVDEEAFPIRFVYVVVTNVAAIDRVASAIEAVMIAQRPEHVEIETSQSAIALRDVIAGRLGASGRQVMAGLLGTGLLLVSATMFAAVSARRRDFGRRRALGASRSVIVAGVLIQTAGAAVPGALLGCTAGVLGGGTLHGSGPGLSFVSAVAVLAVCVALIGAAVPAVVAARRDPVRILRVP